MYCLPTQGVLIFSEVWAPPAPARSVSTPMGFPSLQGPIGAFVPLSPIPNPLASHHRYQASGSEDRMPRPANQPYLSTCWKCRFSARPRPAELETGGEPSSQGLNKPLEGMRMPESSHCSRKLLPLKIFPQFLVHLLPLTLLPPALWTLACPLNSGSCQDPSTLRDCWVCGEIVHLSFMRASGDPGHQGVSIREASRAAASSTPTPSPSVPGGGRLRSLCQNLRRAEGQMGPFPWGLQVPSWGGAPAASPASISLEEVGTTHKPCSTDSPCRFHINPVYTEGLGGGGQIRPACATYLLWDLPCLGPSPLNPGFPVPMK